MKEGYWLNYSTGTALLIDDHEEWIRRPGNAARLGVPQSVIDEACERFQLHVDRSKCLRFIMEQAPVMRIRGHATHVVFEYGGKDDAGAMAGVEKFAASNLSPQMPLRITNLTTGKVGNRELYK